MYKSIGPAYVVIAVGIGTVEGDWTVYKAQNVGVSPGIQTAYASEPFANVRSADGVVQLPADSSISIDLHDVDLASLAELIIGKTVATGTLGLPDSIRFIADTEVPTVGVIPLSQAASGAAAANGFWLPTAMFDDLGEIRHSRIESGQDVVQPTTVVARSLLDNRASGAANAGYRAGFWGLPTTAGFGFVLPTLSTTAI